MTDMMGIEVKQAFAPADIEIEPHFEILAEWRDVRKLKALLRKDIILSSMFDWMKKYNYKFKTSLIDQSKANLGWFLRQTDLGFKNNLPKNMPYSALLMTFALDNTGQAIEKYLTNSLGSNVPFFKRDRMILEHLRDEDFIKFKKKQTTLFHSSFAP